MKYENLQRAHTLVDNFEQADRDLLKPFLPELPKQKTLEEILEDVYEAYMCETEQYNLDRLEEIHYQLTNWGKTPPPREAFSLVEYEELSDESIVLGRDLPWIKEGNLWHNTRGEVRKNENMRGLPREVIRNGNGHVQ